MKTDKDESKEFDVESFFTDPKYAKEADIMRKSVKKVFAEIAAEEEAEREKERLENEKNKKPTGLLDFLFGDK